MLLCRTVHTGCGLDFERLLDVTPSPLFEQWRALYALEPWDAERSDEAIGTLIANMVAAHGVEPKSPLEYMRLLRGEQERQSQAELKEVFAGVCRQMEARQPDRKLTTNPKP